MLPINLFETWRALLEIRSFGAKGAVRIVSFLKLNLIAIGLIVGMPSTNVSATQTDNHGIHAVPAPRSVTIDGKLDDWDLSGQVLMCYNIEELLERYSAKVAMMYDAENLYISVDWKDKIPMGNIHDPRITANKAWAGDCVQFRIKTNEVVHVDCWYFAEKKEPAIHLLYGKITAGNQTSPQKTLLAIGGNKLQEGAEMDFLRHEDGGGYIQEIKLPWKLVTKVPPKSGERFQCGIELLWGEGDWPTHRYADNLAEGKSNREFFYTSDESWGDVFLESAGRLKLPVPAYLAERSKARAPEEGPIRIDFKVPKSSFVTLALDDAQGRRIRNLISAEWREAGENHVQWDGLDDRGAFVPAGEYRLKGLYHDGIHTQYIMSFGNPGNPAWPTPDDRGAFYADHTAPQAVATAGDHVALACPMGEAGRPLIGCDLNGQRLWGQANRVFNGDRITSLATDGKTLWVASDGAAFTIYRVDLATGKYRPWKSETGRDADVPPFDLPVAPPLPGGLTKQRIVGTVSDIEATNLEARNLTAIAWRNGILAACLAKNDRIKLLDAETGRILKEIPIKNPRSVVIDEDGGLIALSEGKLIRVFPDGRKADFSSSTYPDAYGLAMDRAGQVYLSVRGKDQNVKVFDSRGNLLREIGRPGGRPSYGIYDENAMLDPAQIAIDRMDRLWVTEARMNPKRTSVWDTRTGGLVKDLPGTLTYSAAGSVNPHDPTMAFADSTVFKIDLASGKWKPVYSLDQRGDPADIFPPGYSGPIGNSVYQFGLGSRVRCVVNGGNTYVYTADNNICVMFDGKRWRSAAQIGMVSPGAKIRNWVYNSPIFKGHEGQICAWADKNGDGLVQDDEMRFASLTIEGKPLKLGAHWWGSLPGATGTWTFQAEGTRTLVQFPVSGYTGCGAPVYDIHHPGIIPVGSEKIQKEKSPGMIMTGDKDRVYLNQSPLLSVDKDGRELGSYPSNHVAVHDSHNAPSARNGLLIGPCSIIGVAEGSAETGEIFALNGNMGQNYLFTEDCLWIQSLFKDLRGGYQTPLNAVRGASFDDTTAGGESFGGNFIRAGDGRVYLTIGSTTATVLELTGLESIRRFSGTFTFTEEQLAIAKSARKESGDQGAGRAFYAIPEAVRTPGSKSGPEEWPALFDDAKEGIEIKENATERFGRVEARYDSEHLYIAYRVFAGVHQMRNSGSDYRLLFKSGDAVDLMIGEASDNASQYRLLATIFEGKPAAILYENAGAMSRVPLSKKWLGLDRADLAPEVKVEFFPTKEGYFVEMRIPWKLLAIKPVAGLKLKADFGILSADAGGTTTVARRYWANKATGLVNDVPSEAQVSRETCGDLELR